MKPRTVGVYYSYPNPLYILNWSWKFQTSLSRPRYCDNFGACRIIHNSASPVAPEFAPSTVFRSTPRWLTNQPNELRESLLVSLSYCINGLHASKSQRNSRFLRIFLKALKLRKSSQSV